MCIEFRRTLSGSHPIDFNSESIKFHIAKLFYLNVTKKVLQLEERFENAMNPCLRGSINQDLGPISVFSRRTIQRLERGGRRDFSDDGRPVRTIRASYVGQGRRGEPRGQSQDLEERGQHANFSRKNGRVLHEAITNNEARKFLHPER